MIYIIYIKNIYKNEKLDISLEKQLEIAVKIITNWYKYKK